MYTYSINPASIIDEAIDLSTRLSGTAFPISIFPAKIQRIIREVHECHNYPTDYIAAAILTAIAVGIGNTHLAQIKQGWMESPILYMALIGRPGANKSHPLSFAMKPFLDYDYRQNQEFEKALAKYDELMSMSRKERAESGWRAISTRAYPQTLLGFGCNARRVEPHSCSKQTWTMLVGR